MRPIVEEVSDEGLRAKLGEVLHAETYDEARLKLDDLLRQAGDGQEAIDADLMARLKALPNEKAPDTRMKVTYILATEPGTTREGEIIEIHRSAEIRGDEGNTVLIKVAIDKAELRQLRPGATVTAKVYCGRRTLGYVLLYDLIAFVKSRILFRYF